MALARISLFSVLALTLAVAGCGRRGPLEPPPGVPDDKAPRAAVTAPATPSAGAPTGLFRNTSAKTEDPSVTGDSEQKKTRKSATPFVLDPLL